MKDKYIAKIKKLLRLARGTSSPEEAANAIAKAQAYMRQHGISENDAKLFDIQEAASAGAPSDASTPPRYMHILCDLVCKAFGVECYISGEYRASGSLKRHVRFYGSDSRPEIAAYAFDVLSRQMMAERKKYQDKHCKRCGRPRGWPVATSSAKAGSLVPVMSLRCMTSPRKKKAALSFTERICTALRGCATGICAQLKRAGVQSLPLLPVLSPGKTPGCIRELMARATDRWHWGGGNDGF